MTDILLTEIEIKAIAGDLTQPQRQIEELRAQGFWRARLSRSHRVILERSHYHAVCAGAAQGGSTIKAERPKLRPARP